MAQKKQKKRAATAAELRHRRSRSWRIKLPISEAIVEVKEVDTMDLALQGAIPDHLSRHVWEDLADITKDMKPGDQAKALGEHVEMIELVVCASLVSPRCVLESPGDDEITPRDLPYADREFLYQIACGNGGLAVLSRFLEAEERALEASPDGEGVRDEAIADPRDSS